MLTSKTKAAIAVILVSMFVIGVVGGYSTAYILHNKDTSSAKKDPTAEETDAEENAEIDFTNLVVDAFNKVQPDDNEDLVYTIPKIDSDRKGVAEFNQRMYDELYGLYEKSEREYEQYGYFRSLAHIKYSWTHKGNTVSILASTHNTEWYNPQFYAYNFSFDKEKELSREEFISECGYTTESFNAKLRETVQNVSDYVLENTQNNAESQMTFYNEVIMRTLTDEYINQATPLYNSNGELCAVTYIFSLGAADMYKHIINLETGADECNFDCGYKFVS